MEIRTLEIDFDNNVLKVNGRSVTDRPMIVSLPGPFGMPLQKLYNPKLATGDKEDCDRISIIYEVAEITVRSGGETDAEVYSAVLAAVRKTAGSEDEHIEGRAAGKEGAAGKVPGREVSDH